MDGEDPLLLLTKILFFNMKPSAMIKRKSKD
jgi:hypothetical protein